jgi:hypothetical protein
VPDQPAPRPPFPSESLLLLDPLADRILAAWPSCRLGRVRGSAGSGWTLAGWRLDRARLVALVQSDTVSIEDALARLGALSGLVDETTGELAPEVSAYLRRRVGLRLKAGGTTRGRAAQ